MKRVLDASVRIGKVMCSREPDYMTVEIEDALSGIRFLSIDMSMEQFGKVLAGGGSVPVKIEVMGLDNIGKRYEHKPFKFVMTKEDFESIGKGLPYTENKAALAKWVRENVKEEGWYIDAYLGSQGSIHQDYNTGMVTLNLRAYRFVEVE